MHYDASCDINDGSGDDEWICDVHGPSVCNRDPEPVTTSAPATCDHLSDCQVLGSNDNDSFMVSCIGVASLKQQRWTGSASCNDSEAYFITMEVSEDDPCCSLVTMEHFERECISDFHSLGLYDYPSECAAEAMNASVCTGNAIMWSSQYHSNWGCFCCGRDAGYQHHADWDVYTYPTPTPSPTNIPSASPTIEPTNDPSSEPTMEPSPNPTIDPTSEPTFGPSFEPSDEPISAPTMDPTSVPSNGPTSSPTATDIVPEPEGTASEWTTTVIVIGYAHNDDDGDDVRSFWIMMAVIAGCIVLVAVCFAVFVCIKIKAEKKEENQSIMEMIQSPETQNKDASTKQSENEKDPSSKEQEMTNDDGMATPMSTPNGDGDGDGDDEMDSFDRNGEIKRWLTSMVGLPQYYHAFRVNGYDSLEFLMAIQSKQDLREIGVTKKGHINQIWMQIMRLKQENDIKFDVEIVCDEEEDNDGHRDVVDTDKGDVHQTPGNEEML